MTQNEIINMARQAGFKMESSAAIQAAEIFAKLVAAKAIAELESQEPVAWQFMNGSNFRKRRPDDFADLDSDGLPYWKPLYTTPPQRKPLTNEQIWQIATDCTIGGDLHADKFAQAIEAKLKERNT